MLESEHVIVQSNVCERRSKKQMTALRMEGRKKGRRACDDGPANCMSIICAAVFIFSIHFHPPICRGNGAG